MPVMEIFNTRYDIPALEEVISLLKGGVRDFYEILNVPAHKFTDASFEQLMSNEGDVLAGVNKVRMLLNVRSFGVFTNILLKYRDNGDVQAVFFGTTNNVDAVLKTFDLLQKDIGTGIFKQQEFVSFQDVEGIRLLAREKHSPMEKDAVHYWSLADDVSVVLQYTSTPARQFSLLITVNAPRVVDHSPRRKGTIADLLQLNIQDILSQYYYTEGAEEYKDENGTFEFDYRLMQPEFGYFTRMILFVGAEKQQENHLPRLNLEFYKEGDAQPDKVRTIIEQLIKLYGNDNSGYGELEPYEWDKIDNNEFWTGRTWIFNDIHGLWDKEKGDELSYYVRIDNMGDGYGFKLSVLSANRMFELFPPG